MIRLRWISSVLLMPFLRGRSIPLVRPDRLYWNPSLSTKTVQVRGNTIFYVAKGEGDPLLLIHGYGAGMWVWEKQIEVLSRSYKVYALDLLGHGFSDRPKISYTAETYIHCVRGFMEGLGIDKATLVGNSMGGGVAWATAIAHPDRVKRLILIDCVPPDVLDQVRNASFRTLAAVRNIPLLPQLVIASRNRNSIRWVLSECVYDNSLVTEEILDHQYQISRIRGSTWVLYSTLMNARGALRFKEQLSHIPCPTLIVWGEKDLIFPPAVGEGLHKIIPGSRFLLIPRSGHIPMWESSEAVNRAVLSFLQSS
jgi:2-hydroxy-6-oxonona-2,4-dienedioate hydrolase